MLCDMCRKDEYKYLMTDGNVKSSILYMVQCPTCGHRDVKKGNVKRVTT